MLNKVAAEFVRRVRAEIGNDNCKSVDQMNAMESNPNVCHSHDFTDANECMDQALFATGAAFSYTTEDWDAAWNIAKRGGFAEKEKA